jgi:hypothetical protein
MADTGIPPLYDEDRGLREISRARMKRDTLTRGQVIIADRLAEHMGRHFAAEETETAGRALLVGAASVMTLARDSAIPATVVCNILAFAAGRMVADGRAWLDAQGGENGG